MNNRTVEILADTPNAASTTVEDKKDWSKPALERFDIASATQNAGNRPYDDSDHAPAVS